MPLLENNHWNQQLKYIPNGTQTFSKMPERFIPGVYPRFIKKALGCTVEDLKGNLYTDYISALGAIILGHRNFNVDKAVKEQMSEGFLYSLPSQKEWIFAKQLKNHVPCAEKTKIFKTGSESVSAAIRVARSYTKREKILVCGYHGWHDWYTISTDNTNGIPKVFSSLIVKCKYNDLESFHSYLKNNDIAAVIIEPIQFECPNGTFLQDLLNQCHIYGTLLIFDEILTGFRFHIGGVQAMFEIVPDLAVFSKALGNGYPIAVLVGKSEFMDEYEKPGFFVSGTYGGELLGIAAAAQVIKELNWNYGTLIPNRIWSCGSELKEGFNSICKTLELDKIYCDGFEPRTRFNFPSQAHKALFWQECVQRGILFGPSNFITISHTPMLIQHTLNVCEDSLRYLKDNYINPEEKLKGNIPKEIILR